MTYDQNKKTLRHFQCRDYLWEIFEQMSHELECSTDYLINEAMRQYARGRNYGSRASSVPGVRSSVPSFRNTGRPADPPAPAPAPAPNYAAGYGQQPAPGFPPNYPPPQPPQQPAAPHHAAPPQQPAQHPHQPTPQPQLAPPPGFPTAPRQPADYGAPPGPPGYQSYGSGPPGYAPESGSQGYPPPSGFNTNPPPLPGHAAGAQPTQDVPTLYVIFNGQKIPINKREFVIGRGAKTADLAIKDGNISRRHAAVVFENGAYYIKDLGSTNGIEYGGQRIDSKQVGEGDVYQLCDYELRFTYR